MKFVHSFEDLVIESGISLILEGKLTASQEFLERLQSMRDNNIAKFLYDKFSEEEVVEKDLPQNIIDVTDKEDTITFMSDKAFNKSGEDIEDQKIFKLKGRSETRVGRFAKALCNELGKKVSDKEIEEFVNIYKSKKESSTEEFKLVSGDEITYYYHEDNYAGSSGTLGDSCMRYPDCSEYFDIYTENPKVCKLLVYLDEDGNALGRSLIWKIHKMEMDKKECDAKYFMDRIYTIKDSDVIKFKNYAESKGWMYRKLMTNEVEKGGPFIFIHNKKQYIGKIVIKLEDDASTYDNYPYIDTLRYCDGEYLISNVGFVTDGNQFVMDDTEGSSDTCSSCDNSGIVDVGNECQNCHGNGDVKCQECRCKECHEGFVECSECRGECYTTCESCNGDGHKKCTKCKGGIVKACEKCKDEPITCKLCNGSGIYSKKWGLGTRKVKCTECSEGKIHPKHENMEIGFYGTLIPKNSPNRCECSELYIWDRNLAVNTGVVLCDDCSAGTIKCEECDGNGDTYCSECGGAGGHDCKKCNGGILKGKCKNKSCSEGQIQCKECKGTGSVKKNQKVKCSECSGILENFHKRIKSGEVII